MCKPQPQSNPIALQALDALARANVGNTYRLSTIMIARWQVEDRIEHPESLDLK